LTKSACRVALAFSNNANGGHAERTAEIAEHSNQALQFVAINVAHSRPLAAHNRSVD
jgi:hypothetical protein